MPDPNFFSLVLPVLVLVAFNAARAKVDAASSEKMGGITKGLGIPGM